VRAAAGALALLAVLALSLATPARGARYGRSGIPIAKAATATPTVTKVSPKKISSTGGTTVSITGTNLSEASAVTFGSVQATSFLATAKSIVAVAPAHVAGAVDVTVSTPGGTSAASPRDRITFFPTVTAVTPNGGSVKGATAVTIHGSGFATGATAFKFKKSSATMVSCTSQSECSLLTPPGRPKTVEVIALVNGLKSPKNPPADDFTYYLVPSVSAVSPNAGPSAGGSEVTISGAHLKGATAVDFGSRPSPHFTINSDSSITAEEPPYGATLSGGEAHVDVTVTNPGGTSETSAGDEFVYVVAPTIEALRPREGPEAGGTSVRISCFCSRTSAVKFGSANALSFKVGEDGSVTATSPPGSGTVLVTVTTPGGTSGPSSLAEFTYVPPPTVTEVTPRTGPAAGDTPVTITGTNLANASTVRFGSAGSMTFHVVNSTTISAVSPAGSGTVDVVVVSPGGASATSEKDRFTYLAAASA
jgi:IPT/TIG domain